MKKLVSPAAAILGLAALWLVWPLPPADLTEPQGGKKKVPPLSVELADRPALATPSATPGRSRIPVLPNPQDDETIGSLLLRVVREVDGTPLPQIGIRLTPRDGTDPLLAQRYGSTSEEGTVVFDHLAPGAVEIEVDRAYSGEGSTERILQIEAGENEHVIHVPEGVTVEGRVLDAHGSPVPHATLWLDNMRGRWSRFEIGRADAYGGFRLEDLSTPNVFNAVGASAPGYAPSYMYPIRGEPGDTAQLDVQLEGIGASLVGRVLDHEGEPVSGALVIAGGYGGPSKRVSPQLTLSGWAPRLLTMPESSSRPGRSC